MRVKIYVNGESREIPAESTVADLLRQLKLDPRFLAVERNRELVPRTRHHETVLQADDVIEVVTLVGGG